ncbi:P-loop containing nucleoside triphosphate hydrolase protein [Obba rivulosa]|uniref:P-loop containing nucleoside triphosphate hydrolase protein n=1 Tax=Obba rivulosa TaxID=1052685 RepID=A0A8E2DGP2_9APHY|nr:P-loop containing nucleoside triphosphate hydrolase protein [Obba rivulosa]
MPSFDDPVAWQVVLGGNTARLEPSALPPGKDTWRDSFVLPAGVASVSAFLLLLQLLLRSNHIKALRTRLFPQNTVVLDDSDLEAYSAGDNVTKSRISRYVESLGGPAVFAFRITRLLCSFALLALAIFTLMQCHNPSRSAHLLSIGLCGTFAYACFLSVLSLAGKPKLRELACRHLAIVLLVAWGVYVYRNIWPFATYTMIPVDADEGRLLWAKLVLLSVAAVAVPLLSPRQYVPIDRENPNEPIPEQTASILSLTLYFFMDSIILAAWRTSHLALDQLPPLADYDTTSHLVQRSYPHLDPFQAKRKRHLFFGLMGIFWKEYIVLFFMILIRVLSIMASPIGINQLLRYLETGGANAVVRPWVWIVWLFLSPTLAAIAWQWYIFITTRMMVRTEAMITSLLFDHSLRIRVKAETDKTPEDASKTTSTATTPDSASINQSPTGIDPTGSPTAGDEDTLRASSESVVSRGTIDKGKSKSTPEGGSEKPEAPTDEKTKNLVGKLNNLVTVDINRITNARDFLMLFVMVPFQTGLSIWFLYTILSWSALVGLVTMIALFPVPGYMASIAQKIQKEKMNSTDARVQTVTETMNVVRMVKLFGWEYRTADQISEKREEELTWLRKHQFLNLSVFLVSYIIPLLVMLTTFVTYSVIMRQDMTASKVFSSMAAFELLAENLHRTLGYIPIMIQGKVSLDRVAEFLYKTELLDQFSTTEEEVHVAHVETPGVIGIRNSAFTWSSEGSGTQTPGGSRRKFTLRVDDELILKRGAINLVVGPTGSGKTSLLMALLGEMHYIPNGPDSFVSLPRECGVGYAAQESWVQNETIRDNILFGHPYDEERYNKVIHQCALKRDLSLFEAGDQTEVGEKGLTLSGGQKARITLARAVYSSAEILLLDDVLAALDVHTAKWIVDKCFKGDLIRGRTVILVTHNVAVASSVAEFVVSMGTDGRIASQGALSRILAKDPEFSAQVKEESQEIEKAEEVDEANLDAPARNGSDGKLIVEEEIAIGHIGWPAMKLYAHGLGGARPFLFWITFIGALLLVDLAATLQTWFLGYWAQQYEDHDPNEVKVAFYLDIYSALLLFVVTVYGLAYVVFIYGSLRASRKIHRDLVTSILGTTLRWLDKTPVSRIIARCTQDIDSVDSAISSLLSNFLDMSLLMLVKFCSIIVLSPLFIIPGSIITVLGAFCGQLYMKAQLCVKREMSNARAPVLGHFGAAIAGLTSIRAYGAQDMFRKESFRRINQYTRAAVPFYNLNRWLCIRTDALGGLFAALLAAYLIYGGGARASNTGFSLTMAVSFSGMILWWIRVLNELELNGRRLGSLERISQYLEIEHEPKPTADGEPPAYWPSSGDLKVEHLFARYSPDGPAVLQDVCFEVKAGERVGIVGRTGSGKSSLTLALLRCIFTEGKVYYDGLPTDSINLDSLRSNITIIPQVPELLSGTLRQNLDPFDQYDDAALNSALRAAGLFSLQNEDDEGCITLDSQIASGGSNLSVGQRQILALARAIVRQSKLLILDEATSAIDFATDAVIQQSLRHELGRDVTLLTVAHRLQTIMDADKIMVLDAGRIVEFDKPSELLKHEKGLLRALVEESGDKELLYSMTQGVSYPP